MDTGGAERVFSHLINGLVKDKHEIHLLLFDEKITYPLHEGLKIKTLSKERSSAFLKLLELPFLASKLKRYIKNHQIGTVISFLYRPNYVNLISKLLGSMHKSIIGIRSTTSIFYTSLGLIGKINLFLIKTLFGRAELIISNSQGVKIDLDRHFHFSNEHIVIPNPVDLEFIEKYKTRDINGFDFRADKKYIISVGRLIPLKRNKDLIFALHEILDEAKEYEIIFLGEGDQRTCLEQIARELGIDTSVHLLGMVNNPYQYIGKSDIFVLNSETEGFPNVLIEAMACKIPVISTDCESGPREILAPGTDFEYHLADHIELAKYGILVPVKNQKLLSKALLKLIRDPELWKKYADAAYTRAQSYSKEVVLKDYFKVLLNEN